MLAPIAGADQDGLAATVAGLVERGWDAHLVLDAEDAAGGARVPSTDGVADRVHCGTDHRPKIGELRRRLRRMQPLLRRLDLGLLHFTCADHARRRLHLAADLEAKTMVRFSARDAGVAGLEDPDYFVPVWERSDLLEVSDDAVGARVRARGAPPGRTVALVPPFAHPELLAHEPTTRTPARQRPLRVLSAGRLDWAQGYEHALMGVARLTRQGVAVEWRIAGEGPDLGALAFGCHQLGVADRVSFQVATTPIARRRNMIWADVLLAPEVIDGLPAQVVDACAMGLPVVMSDPGRLGELSLDDATIIVGRRDPLALAAALGALAGDAEARRRMGAAARRWALSHLRLEDHLDRLDGLYRRLLAAGSPAETHLDDGPRAAAELAPQGPAERFALLESE